MSGDDSINTGEKSIHDVNASSVVRVGFPYASPQESHETAPPPSVKIDYTAIELPGPRKTINVRRNPSKTTRVVRLDIDGGEQKRLKTDVGEGNAGKAVPENLAKNLDLIARSTQETQRQYACISQSLAAQNALLPKVDALQKQLEQSHKVETANQRLFDAMHEELKGYKDNFLLDALQKPVIRDLVALFDDLSGQARRTARFLSENTDKSVPASLLTKELQGTYDNTSNTVFFILEVLNRLDVSLIENEDKMLDLKCHKVVGVEATTVASEKNLIARVVRPGFNWRNRVLRPTEVISRKFIEPTENLERMQEPDSQS